MQLSIETSLTIAKPSTEVFNAIVDPEQMSNYFIASSSGMMREGSELTWRFPELDEEVKIKVGRIEKDEYISYTWQVGDQDVLVEMKLGSAGAEKTLVRITEGPMENDEAGIKWLKSNTAGWANFLDCLKAYLEFGINLRKGGFDHYRKK